ncbi:hypothetical protein [Chromobacterium vaccinii]|uniref:hypothetical protein n=1 Tax=Chromobacterium vaccinii TaxID=1108595 RepID=UPI001E580FF4|nr:hypothetical protein [Chromobacterium vaccinii]MCD4502306.1 hypothetical protein [Chromobacterium vaccinii]
MKPALTLAALVTLAGCSEPDADAIVTLDTAVYAAVSDARDKPTFTVKSGTACKVGETVYGKVDAYTEVICGDRRGWVLDAENLKIIKH